jgi:putative ABC transport system substrate-binding protein
MPQNRHDSSGFPRIGVLLAGDRSYSSFATFRKGMRDVGQGEDQTFTMEMRFAAGQLDQPPVLRRS